MPLSPKHVSSTAPSSAEPGEAPQGFREWSRHQPDPMARSGQPLASSTLTIDVSHPLVKVAAAVFIGYTLGRILHRH